MPHGRAVMPWGKYKGVRIRLLPDSYLSWLSTAMQDHRHDSDRYKWWWLLESLKAELRYRGFREDLADTADPPPVEVPDPPRRKIRL